MRTKVTLKREEEEPETVTQDNEIKKSKANSKEEEKFIQQSNLAGFFGV